jgi:hypothetical protein
MGRRHLYDHGLRERPSMFLVAEPERISMLDINILPSLITTRKSRFGEAQSVLFP